MNTIDLTAANQLEIMRAFRITRDLSKKIDRVKPTNQSELLAITGFPSNYFDDTDCKQVTYWGQKSSVEIMKEQEASSHADATGTTPGGSSNDQNDPGNLRKMIIDMQSHQNKLTRQFEESQKEIHSLKMSISGMSMKVSQTCMDIKKSVDKLQGALVDPTMDTSEGEDSESKDSGNNGHCRKDPQFDQLTSNVSHLISSQEQGLTHILLSVITDMTTLPGAGHRPLSTVYGSPWKRDQIPTAQHYGNRGDTPPRRYNYPDSPHRGQEGYGNTGSPMRRPSNDRYADHYHKREQRDVSIPRHRSYENRSYENGRRMLKHNNSDEKYVTSVRQLGMEETPPASLDKCDQFAETSDPPHAEDEEARYHHEEDELSLNY